MGTTIKTTAFDDSGNITQKDGVSYQYHTAGSGAGPHAMSKHGGSSYYYDNNGNMTAGGGRNLIYSTFNKPTRITKGSTSVYFNYNPGRSRYKRINKVGSTIIDTKITAAGVEVIKKGSSTTGTTEVRKYVGNALLKYRYNGSSSLPTKTVSYIYKDHLGSTDTVINSANNAVTKMSFDSYGSRRRASGFSQWSISTLIYSTTTLQNITDKGYTGHEQLDNVGLIHMNGRVYDPTLGRFLSADPNIQAPTDTQSLNRYAYVLNNPLSATDPSGYFSISKAWKKIRPFASIIALAIPVVREWAIATWYNAATVGFTTGALTSGTLKGALIGAFSAVAFQQIGEYARAGASEVPKDLQTWEVGDGAFVTGSKYAEVVALHAVAGGVISVLNGSKFGYGFVSAGFTKSLGHSIAQLGDNQELQSLVTVIVGGTASRLSGGKFANGATTAAFQVALNFFGGSGASGKARKLFKSLSDADKESLKQLLKETDGLIELMNRPQKWGDLIDKLRPKQVYLLGKLLHVGVQVPLTKSAIDFNKYFIYEEMKLRALKEALPLINQLGKNATSMLYGGPAASGIMKVLLPTKAFQVYQTFSTANDINTLRILLY